MFLSCACIFILPVLEELCKRPLRSKLLIKQRWHFQVFIAVSISLSHVNVSLCFPHLRVITSNIDNPYGLPPTALCSSIIDPTSSPFSNVAIASILAVATDPVVEMVWNGTLAKMNKKTKEVDFKNTISFGVADSIAVGARVYLALLVADNAEQHLRTILPFPPELVTMDVQLRDVALNIAVTVWAALSISTIKRLVFLQSVSGNSLGRVALYDRLLDFVIVLLATLLVLENLHIDFTMGVQSLFTAGGVGALLFSLASRGLAEQIVSGFILNAWDAIEEGNEVILGDKTEGIVNRIGLVETEILGYDNIIVKIPNSQLTGQRISNLSRVTKSRVRQVLRFKYSDLDKLPRLLTEMKSEISTSCPKLISDGSKPFQAVLSSYESDHIAAYVNCHFDIPPATEDFVENRQQVLLAIARTMKRHDVDFALPSILYKTSSDKRQS